MPINFPLFNLEAEIEEYNQNNGPQHTFDETFGLSFFTKDIQEYFQRGISLFNQYHYQYLFGIKTKEERKKELEVLASAEECDLKDIRKLVSDMRKDQQKAQEFEWRKSQAQSLSQHKIWEKLGVQVDSLKKAQLKEMENIWLVYGNYSTHTDQALLESLEILPHLEAVLVEAIKELKKHCRSWSFSQKMPREIAHKYENYLKECLEAIHREQRNIAQTMLIRLQLAGKRNDLMASDVLMSTIHTLEEKNLLKKGFTLNKRVERNLNEEMFLAFHEMVLKHGTVESKQQLLELPWFQQTEAKTNSLHSNNGQTPVLRSNNKRKNNKKKKTKIKIKMAASRILKIDPSLIPSKPRFPQFIFKGTAIRYEYGRHFYGYAGIKTALNRQETELNIGTMTYRKFSQLLTEFHCAENLVYKEKQRVKKHLEEIGGIRRFFTGETREFLNGLDKNLDEDLKHLYQQQVELVDRVNDAIEYDLFSEEKELTKDEENILINFINGLVEALTLGFPKEEILNQRLKASKAVLLERIQAHRSKCEDEKARAERLSQEEALLKPFSESTESQPTEQDLQNLLDYYNQLEKPGNQDTEVFLAKMDTLLQKAQKQTQYYLQCSAFPNSEKVKGQEEFLRMEAQSAILYGRLIQEVGKLSDRLSLSKNLDDYEYGYLSRLSGEAKSTLSLGEHNTYSEVQESVLLALSYDDKQKQKLFKLQVLRKENRFQTLGEECQKESRILASRIVFNHFEIEMKRLEKVLFSYLQRHPDLEITEIEMNYLLKLRDEMVKNNQSDLTKYSGLTSADKTFLGLNQLGFLEGLLTADRKPLRAVINVSCKLYLEAKKLIHIRDIDQQKHHIEKVKEAIKAEITVYGDLGAQKLLVQHGQFSASISVEAGSTAQVSQIPSSQGRI
jgi:hypothetical protein